MKGMLLPTLWMLLLALWMLFLTLRVLQLMKTYKQSVPLALNIFHETISAGIISYFANETAAAGFLKLINIWWTVSNSKVMFTTNNRIDNAVFQMIKTHSFFEILRHESMYGKKYNLKD